jgi:hypothetical protein
MNAPLLPRGRMPKVGGLLCVVAILAASGCGRPNTAAVSGKVTYRGQPVPGALILQAADAEAGTAPAVYRAAIGPDGRYSTCGVPDGAYRAAVAPAPASFAGPMPGSTGMPPGVKATPLTHVDIPARYLWPGTSGLTLEVKGGSMTRDFSLTD